jgi:hypothetical protein
MNKNQKFTKEIDPYEEEESSMLQAVSDIGHSSDVVLVQFTGKRANFGAAGLAA